jgi:hypothetical protein
MKAACSPCSNQYLTTLKDICKGNLKTKEIYHTIFRHSHKMHAKHILPLAMFGLQAAASSASTTRDHTFSFNDMLDGSLGDMPAMWLVTHGALAALNNTTTTFAKRNETASAPATTSSAPTGRDDKENGAALAAFIGSALTFPIKLHESNSKMKALCQTLVASSTGMLGAVVGQEAGKSIYGENSTAPDFEEGLVPGAFIGGIVGTATGTQLSKTLCELAVPGFKEFLDDLDDLGLKGAERIMAQSSLQVIDATLDTLGVERARITQFSGQLQQALRFVHLHGSAAGVERLTRALTRESAELANAFAEGVPLSSPAISALAGFGSLNAAALGLPPVAPPPAMAGLPGLGPLTAITAQLSHVIDFARTLPLAHVSMEAQAAADMLRDRFKEAADAPNPGLTGHMKDVLKTGSKLAHGLLDTLDRLRPGKSACQKNEHTSVVTETHEYTTTATRVRTSVVHETHEHTTTATREHTATATIHETETRTGIMVVEHPAVTVTLTSITERVETVTKTVWNPRITVISANPWAPTHH